MYVVVQGEEGKILEKYLLLESIELKALLLALRGQFIRYFGMIYIYII